MKHIWSVLVLFVYIYGTDKLVLTKAEQIIIYSSKAPNTLTCPDPYVIKIEDATINGENSTCSRDECVLSDSDFENIKGICNDSHSCSINYPLNYSCLRENRYFNLSYTCLVPRNLACSFEFSWCNWRNVTGSNYVNWIRTSPATQNIQIPGEDHSTNSNAGYFLYTTKQGPNKTAVVGSGKMLFNEDKCLVIWYNMDSKSELRIYKSTNDRKFTLLLAKMDGSKTWQHTNVTLEKGLPYEIFINVTVDVYIAIDDTDIQDWPCNAIQPVTCNFEQHFCNFEVQPEFGLKWQRQSKEDNSIGRPSLDHTKQVNGYYVYAESIYQVGWPRVRLIIPFDNTFEAGCLSLWYYIYGDTPGDLYIYVVVNGSEKIVSLIRDARKELWRQFLVNVSKTEEIILEYNYTRRNLGGIALDDVYIAPIVCAGQESLSNECVEKEEPLNFECQFDDVLNDALIFDPKLPTSCPITNDNIFNNFRQILHQCNDAVCEFTPANLLKNDTCFMMLKHVLVRYKCIDSKTPENNSVETISTSSQLDDPKTPENNSVETISTSSQLDDRITPENNSVETISTSSQFDASNPMYTIIIVSVLVIVLTALGAITVVCYKRKTAKPSQHIATRQDETANEITDSKDYTAINYNEMRDIDTSKIKENKKDTITTQCDLQGNTASVEKEENNCNKYETLATIRNSKEHIYESGYAHDNEYQSLTNQRELNEHTYESTEHASAQYQSLTKRSESDNHAYESTSLQTDELQNKK